GVLAADDAEYRAPHVVLATPQSAPLAHALYLALDAETVPVDAGCYHRVALAGAFVSLSLSPAYDTSRAPVGQRLVTAVMPDGSLAPSDAAPEALLAAAVERVLPGARATFRHYAEPAALARLLDAPPALDAPPTRLEGLWAASDGGLINGGSGAAARTGIASYKGIQRALGWAARRRELALLRQRRAS
ncbi:MAG: hypothetical protein H7Y32_09195, partial [Chloroflexales bacterium]|nr:hypothetical protein [Chloroflexales bacterium]